METLSNDLNFAPFNEDLREAYLDYAREFKRVGEPDFDDKLPQAETDWAAFARQRLDAAAGRNLPDGAAPQTDYFLFRDRRIVADSALRHRLSEFLQVIGGHIGYGVRPSERRKGYATLILRLTLAKAGALGLSRVLLTCDKDNLASARVIQKNGGVLEDEVISPRSGKLSQRYWIDLESDR